LNLGWTIENRKLLKRNFHISFLKYIYPMTVKDFHFSWHLFWSFLQNQSSIELLN
jgi:hypothetical protein